MKEWSKEPYYWFSVFYNTVAATDKFIDFELYKSWSYVSKGEKIEGDISIGKFSTAPDLLVAFNKAYSKKITDGDMCTGINSVIEDPNFYKMYNINALIDSFNEVICDTSEKSKDKSNLLKDIFKKEDKNDLIKDIQRKRREQAQW